MSSAKFIRLIKNGKSLLRFKLQETPLKYNTLKGEVDIIIDSASKKTPFEKACIQTAVGRQFVQSPVNYVSWHGFYATSSDLIRFPVINFHNGTQKKEHRHTGTINQNDLFLFPICSVYIPKEMETKSLNNYLPIDNTETITLIDSTNARIDFFVLPKSIKMIDFSKNFSHSIFVFLADISIFDKSLNGMFQTLPVDGKNPPLFQSFTIHDWDVIVRVVYATRFRETDVDQHYSILFHDPNDALVMLLNRKITYISDDKSTHKSSFQKRYDEETVRWKKKD